MTPPVAVTPAPGEACELDAADHRGEVYRFALRLDGGVLEFLLCRHHARGLNNRLDEV